MVNLKELYLKLCMSSVFSSVLDKKIFTHFFKYCTSEQKHDKIRAYAAFVSEIYQNGGSLTDYIKQLLLEDENVYIKAMAHKNSVREEIKSALDAELNVFECFATLADADFASDMGIDYVSRFESHKIDLKECYRERICGISKYGYGIFSSYPMFRLSDKGEIEPIISRDKTSVEKFVGYERERNSVIENTVAFIENRPAANVLLCGDAGTGKSSTVKAIANMFFDSGVRLIELRKDQLHHIPYVMGKISENPLKFIIFIDDLSFNQSDDNFSMLKAALEGSASAKAVNAVIYATSNRRHIVRESFADRDSDDVHRNDTMQETLSLSERFGLVVLFERPNKKLYLDIVFTLAERSGIRMNKDELAIKAEAFALKRGSRSARCAEQFIESLL